MKKIKLIWILLLLFSPTLAFSEDIEDIVQSQKESVKKQAEETKRQDDFKKYKAQCVRKITEVINTRFVELLSKGVKFSKNPGGYEYTRIEKKLYLPLINDKGEIECAREAILKHNNELLISQSICRPERSIYFEPEHGATIEIGLGNFKQDGSWLMTTAHAKYQNDMRFESCDSTEIEESRQEIYAVMSEAIKTAIY